jgi:mono/diheme cytochrome c family protein
MGSNLKLIIAVLISIALTLAACGEQRAAAPSSATFQTAAPSGPVEGDPEAGAQLWRTKQCAACHGTNGAGGMGGALVNTALPFDQFLSKVRNAIPPKPALTASDLSDSEAYSIYLWLHTQSPAPVPAAASSPGMLPTGQLLGIQVWSEKGCSGCHGAFAQGSEKGPLLAGETYPFERERAVMRASADKNPAHSASNIPDDLLQRLLDWLRRGADPTSGC